MNEPHWDRLINGHFDDALTADERREFEALMLESASARRRFWQLAEIHGLGREAGRLASPSSVPPERLTSARTRIARPSWFRWGPLPAAAAGLFIGLFTASTVFANVMPSFIRTWALLRDGFETGPAPANTGIPNQPGFWGGDYAEITGEQQGVKPASGSKMLRFMRADFSGKTTPDSYIGDMHQLIDVRPYRQELADGGAVVQLSALFNAFAFPTEESYDGSATIYALDAETATNGSLNIGNAPNTESLAMTNSSHLKIDRLPETWQLLTAELRLPPNTDFILVRFGLMHGNAAQRRATFDGHYLDDVRVTLARRAPLP
ncbi:MAG TPA: hypothetical protein VHX44_17630 [Planctomycetota bacterium]|nr:hypothetical protein [Planctomycetota bacterium]